MEREGVEVGGTCSKCTVRHQEGMCSRCCSSPQLQLLPTASWFSRGIWLCFTMSSQAWLVSNLNGQIRMCTVKRFFKSTVIRLSKEGSVQKFNPRPQTSHPKRSTNITRTRNQIRTYSYRYPTNNNIQHPRDDLRWTITDYTLFPRFTLTIYRCVKIEPNCHQSHGLYMYKYTTQTLR